MFNSFFRNHSRLVLLISSAFTSNARANDFDTITQVQAAEETSPQQELAETTEEQSPAPETTEPAATSQKSGFWHTAKKLSSRAKALIGSIFGIGIGGLIVSGVVVNKNAAEKRRLEEQQAQLAAAALAEQEREAQRLVEQQALSAFRQQIIDQGCKFLRWIYPLSPGRRTPGVFLQNSTKKYRIFMFELSSHQQETNYNPTLDEMGLVLTILTQEDYPQDDKHKKIIEDLTAQKSDLESQIRTSAAATTIDTIPAIPSSAKASAGHQAATPLLPKTETSSQLTRTSYRQQHSLALQGRELGSLLQTFALLQNNSKLILAPELKAEMLKFQGLAPQRLSPEETFFLNPEMFPALIAQLQYFAEQNASTQRLQAGTERELLPQVALEPAETTPTFTQEQLDRIIRQPATEAAALAEKQRLATKAAIIAELTELAAKKQADFAVEKQARNELGEQQKVELRAAEGWRETSFQNYHGVTTTFYYNAIAKMVRFENPQNESVAGYSTEISLDNPKSFPRIWLGDMLRATDAMATAKIENIFRKLYPITEKLVWLDLTTFHRSPFFCPQNYRLILENISQYATELNIAPTEFFNACLKVAKNDHHDAGESSIKAIVKQLQQQRLAEAATTIQRMARKIAAKMKLQAKRKERKAAGEEIRQTEAATNIQALFRGRLARKQIKVGQIEEQGRRMREETTREKIEGESKATWAAAAATQKEYQIGAWINRRNQLFEVHFRGKVRPSSTQINTRELLSSMYKYINKNIVTAELVSKIIHWDKITSKKLSAISAISDIYVHDDLDQNARILAVMALLRKLSSCFQKPWVTNILWALRQSPSEFPENIEGILKANPVTKSKIPLSSSVLGFSFKRSR